jgi:hypothetical protein
VPRWWTGDVLFHAKRPEEARQALAEAIAVYAAKENVVGCARGEVPRHELSKKERARGPFPDRIAERLVADLPVVAGQMMNLT